MVNTTGYYGLAFVIVAAATACTRPLAHPCSREADCAVGWSCRDSLCQPAAPSYDGGPDTIDDGAADARDGVRRDLGQDQPADRGPEVAGSGPNYMFVTSMTYSPGFRSLSAADGNCNGLAAIAGLPGTYRAWLSTTDVRAIDRLAGARAWIRPDGAPFADTVDDIANGRILNPPFIDEKRHAWPGLPIENVPPEIRVMTGTEPAGGPAAGSTCDDWSTYLGTGGGGSLEWTTDSWTTGYIFNCGERVHMYCFGVDRAEPLAPAAVEGKLAFVSDGQFVPTGGIDAADALCASEAADAGLGGRFKALLTTAAATSAARFSQFGQTRWVRVDGIPLNAPGERLDLGVKPTPLNVTARKTYLGYVWVFLGAGDPYSASVLGTCDDWRNSTSGSVVGQVANSAVAGNGARIDCGTQAHIYCFEE